MSDPEEAEGFPDVSISFDEPERISTVRSSFEFGATTVPSMFPALSLTALRGKVGDRVRLRTPIRGAMTRPDWRGYAGVRKRDG